MPTISFPMATAADGTEHGTTLIEGLAAIDFTISDSKTLSIGATTYRFTSPEEMKALAQEIVSMCFFEAEGDPTVSNSNIDNKQGCAPNKMDKDDDDDHVDEEDDDGEQ